MSVATSSLVNPTRSRALMVRLAPHLVEAICELTRALKDKTHAQTEISGLLFGKSQEGMLTIEALKTFKDSSGPRSDLARRERMEKAFTAAMALANEDPEFAAYKLLGWFSLRGGGGLINSDIEFHNGHFRNTEDIALVVWREGDTQLTAELYAAVDGSKLTTEDYRWSSVRLSTELRRVSQPLDLVMRVRMNDDLYLRTYGLPDGRERKEEWKKIAEGAKRTILALLPGRGQSDVVYPAHLPLPVPAGTANRSFESRTLFRGIEPEPSLAAVVPPPVISPKPAETKPAAPNPAGQIKPIAATTPATPPLRTPPQSPPQPAPVRATETPASVVSNDVNRAPRANAVPEISGLPMVIPKHKIEPKRTPWLSMSLVFILCSGVTFAVLALKNAGNGDGKVSQIMRVLFPGNDLELRASSHGDSLWISWNRRNPAVSASSGGVLTVSDGPRHFDRKLDASQVADGEVKYTPVSGDVTFQLRVFGSDQSVALGSLRVLDATNQTSEDSKAPLDLSNPTSAEANTANKSVTPPAETPPARSTEAASNKVNLPIPELPPAHAPTSTPATAAKAPVEVPKSTSAQPQRLQQTPVQSAQQQAAPVSPRPTTSNNATPFASNTSINGWDPAQPEIKPAAQPQQQAQQAAPPDSKTIDFIGPKVLVQVAPNARSLTAGSITEVTRVEVEVRVDTSGHVIRAILANPNVKSQLGAAATAAAKQWIFQPATLRGQRVESDHTIVFEFRPEGQ